MSWEGLKVFGYKAGCLFLTWVAAWVAVWRIKEGSAWMAAVDLVVMCHFWSLFKEGKRKE
jgi:hypothetical protein